jgi:Immunoglobulin-like domain of bacterial spore germination/Sporulation and spore germination
MNADQDDLIATRLSQVLDDAAAAVVPANGSLQQVLQRANRPRPRAWGQPVLAAAAAVVVVAAAAALLARAHGIGAPGGGPTQSRPPAGAVVTSTATASPTPTATASAPAPLVFVPVYFAGVFDGQARLYREFVPAHAVDRGRAAAALSIAGRAADPDYMSLWPAGTTLVSYQVSGTVADLVLSSAPGQYPAMAVQQLVYTVTAADQSVRSVRLSYGATDLGPVSRADPSATLAPVWVLTPAQGATVHSPVRFAGTASVFEAVVSYQLDRLDGTKVAAGTWMASTGSGIGSWSGQLSVPPGQYVISAYEVSAKDGSRRWVDSKSFTVR